MPREQDRSQVSGHGEGLGLGQGAAYLCVDLSAMQTRRVRRAL